tara:strand:- start:2540 stop:3262 length:723 start_codon:yes stop_codon:yes gene_type:complete
MFGGALEQPQVDGINALLASCARNRVADPHHVSNILSNVKRETGGYMSPIKETVYATHKNKKPSDATVKRRLEAAWRAGKLYWVKTPYWRDGAFGRGMIQITHWINYVKLGDRLGLPLRANPDLALKIDVSADIAVVGMSEGLFTGKKLSDYRFPDDLVAKPSEHPRRIVNGEDGTDNEISHYHRSFYAALKAAGYGTRSESPAPNQQPAKAPQKPIDAPKVGWLAALLNILASFLKGRK